MSVPGSGGCSMISVAILEDGCKSYNYRIPWLPQLSLQILIACSSFHGPRHSVFLFLQLQFFGCWTGCGDLRRFIAINRWIILLKSGNNHPCSSWTRRQLLLRSLRLYFSENPTKPISEASCILVVNCKSLTGKLTRFKGFAVSDTLFKGWYYYPNGKLMGAQTS